MRWWGNFRWRYGLRRGQWGYQHARHNRVQAYPAISTVLAIIALALSAVALLTGCSTYGGQAVKVSPATTGPSSAAPAAKAKGLVPADVKITLKVKTKQCFGDAGCNVTVVPVVGLGQDPGDDQTYEITFKVYGDSSGPVIETITMTGDKASSPEILLSTSKASVKIHAKVTDVEKWAY